MKVYAAYFLDKGWATLDGLYDAATHTLEAVLSRTCKEGKWLPYSGGGFICELVNDLRGDYCTVKLEQIQ